VGHGGFGQVELGTDVEPERVGALLVADLIEALVGHLIGGIAGQRVDTAEFFDDPVNHRSAVRRVGEIPGCQHASAPGLLDDPRNLLRVLVFVEVGDEDVRALPGEGDRDGATDAAVTAGDDRSLVGQLGTPASNALHPWRRISGTLVAAQGNPLRFTNAPHRSQDRSELCSTHQLSSRNTVQPHVGVGGRTAPLVFTCRRQHCGGYRAPR
jgi:hypothetical protein